jgi:hypothetical protein
MLGIFKNLFLNKILVHSINIIREKFITICDELNDSKKELVNRTKTERLFLSEVSRVD